MLHLSHLLAAFALCAAEICPGLGVPEEIGESELQRMIAQVPVEQSGFLFDVEFVSNERFVDVARLLSDPRYGVRLSYAEEVCGPWVIYVFVLGADGWSLDSRISQSGPLVCTSPQDHVCGTNRANDPVEAGLQDATTTKGLDERERSE